MNDWIYRWMNQVSANRNRIRMHFIAVMQVLWLFNTFTFSPYFLERATFQISLFKFIIFWSNSDSATQSKPQYLPFSSKEPQIQPVFMYSNLLKITLYKKREKKWKPNSIYRMNCQAYTVTHHLTAAKFAHCLDKNNSCSRQPQFMEIKQWES